MVGAQTNITDLQRFLYLKVSLRDSALEKISIYNVSAENYRHGVESYDKKRILITRHLDAIMDLP